MRKKQATTLRQRVRVFLAQRDMTQAALASQLGITESALSQILHGRSRPSLQLAVKLEALTGIPVRDFAEVA